MRQQRNLVGKKFGKLLVIEMCGQLEKGKHYMSKVRCECGKEYLVPDTELIYGRRLCCKKCSKPNQTHGMTNTKLFNVWQSMKQRCNDKNHKDYIDYGKRGITVCKEWECNFLNFYNWAIDNGYKEGLTIDRINVNGNYEPTNCRWVDLFIQANNKRNNVVITYNGVKDTLQNWARKYDLKSSTLYWRITNNWEVEKALTIKAKRGQNQYG